MRVRFDTSFKHTDFERRARHGLVWNAGDYRTLHSLFKAGASLHRMCDELQRPADGVLSKLESEHLISFDSLDGNYYRVAEDKPGETTFTPEPPRYYTNKFIPHNPEITMNKTIESKTFINGAEAANMTDAEIFRLIAKTEGEIAKLKDIKTPSTKLQAAIDAMEADVIKLAKYVDNRD